MEKFGTQTRFSIQSLVFWKKWEQKMQPRCWCVAEIKLQKSLVKCIREQCSRSEQMGSCRSLPGSCRHLSKRMRQFFSLERISLQIQSLERSTNQSQSALQSLKLQQCKEE